MACKAWISDTVRSKASNNDASSSPTEADSLGTTIVLVTHELPSIFELGDNAVFLDAERKTMIAQGKPSDLKDSPEPKVRAFMSRGRV